MDFLKTRARIALGLCGLSILAIVLSHLALTDIWRGEGDLSLEWSVLRVAMGLVLVSQGWIALTLVRLLRN